MGKNRDKKQWHKLVQKTQKIIDDFPIYQTQLTHQQFLNEQGIYFSQKDFDWLVRQSKKNRYRRPGWKPTLHYRLKWDPQEGYSVILIPSPERSL